MIKWGDFEKINSERAVKVIVVRLFQEIMQNYRKPEIQTSPCNLYHR